VDILDLHFLAADLDCSGQKWIKPKQSSDHFCSPSTHEAGKADYFTRPHTESDVLELGIIG